MALLRLRGIGRWCFAGGEITTARCGGGIAFLGFGEGERAREKSKRATKGTPNAEIIIVSMDINYTVT
jgi:hypothetical protein